MITNRHYFGFAHNSIHFFLIELDNGVAIIILRENYQIWVAVSSEINIGRIMFVNDVELRRLNFIKILIEWLFDTMLGYILLYVNIAGVFFKNISFVTFKGKECRSIFSFETYQKWDATHVIKIIILDLKCTLVAFKLNTWLNLIHNSLEIAIIFLQSDNNFLMAIRSQIIYHWMFNYSAWPLQSTHIPHL